MRFKEEFKEMVLTQHKSVRQFSEHTGINRWTLLRYVNNTNTRLNMADVSIICKALKCQLPDILELT